MATTTNFGWETPDDTDLVKDGALAMRTLGNAIDTSLVDLKGGTTGQVLSKTSNTDMDFTWVTSDDANAIQNAIVDAKGDLIAASAADTPARLAVGNNGETLVADSSATTGLRWQGDYAAGKNKIINGDFRINQRAFSSTTTTATYMFDRFYTGNSGGTVTYSAQTFTAGTAPVAGYEAINFLRIDTTGQSAASDFATARQAIEDVRTFANQTITVSFWAKAASGTPQVGVSVRQGFGTGGSPSTTVNTAIGAVTISSSWSRYSVTATVPSISGKTIGTDANSSSLQLLLFTSSGTNFTYSGIGIQTATIDFWGIQVEAGNVATAFQTATGTLAGELAACKRYLPSIGVPNANSELAIGYAYATNAAIYQIPFDVQARVAPTGITLAGTFNGYAGNTATAITPVFNSANVNGASVVSGTFTITSGQGSRLAAGSNSYILFTGCEL